MIDDDLSDEQLMLLVKGDNAEAFEALFHRHKRPLLGYLWRTSGGRNEAEDLLQDVFLQVWRARATWEPVAKLTTWLYTIARNACTNRLVRAGRERVRLDRLARAWRPATPSDGPHVRLQAEETEAAIRGAVAHLPERQREVLLLREVSGLGYAEIAGVTGWPMGTVKTELHRARRALAARIGEALR